MAAQTLVCAETGGLNLPDAPVYPTSVGQWVTR